jgi:hypothetical protein
MENFNQRDDLISLEVHLVTPSICNYLRGKTLSGGERRLQQLGRQ